MPATEQRMRVVGTIGYLEGVNGLLMQATLEVEDDDFCLTFKVPHERRNDIIQAYHFNRRLAASFTLSGKGRSAKTGRPQLYIKDLTFVIEMGDYRESK